MVALTDFELSGETVIAVADVERSDVPVIASNDLQLTGEPLIAVTHYIAQMSLNRSNSLISFRFANDRSQ